MCGVEDSASHSEKGAIIEIHVPKRGFLPDRSLFKEDFEFPMDRTCMQPTPEVSTMLPLGILADHSVTYDGHVSVPHISERTSLDDLFCVHLPVEMVHMGVCWVDGLPEGVISNIKYHRRRRGRWVGF